MCIAHDVVLLQMLIQTSTRKEKGTQFLENMGHINDVKITKSLLYISTNKSGIDWKRRLLRKYGRGWGIIKFFISLSKNVKCRTAKFYGPTLILLCKKSSKVIMASYFNVAGLFFHIHIFGCHIMRERRM